MSTAERRWIVRTVGGDDAFPYLAQEVPANRLNDWAAQRNWHFRQSKAWRFTEVRAREHAAELNARRDHGAEYTIEARRLRQSKAIAAAVEAEREACAVLAETHWATTVGQRHGDEAARRIRARGAK